MDNIVISFGGSILFSKDLPFNYFKKLSDLIDKFSRKYKIYIVIGGGNIARTYIKMGRDLGLNEKSLDDFGIIITRVNAKFLTNIINNSNKEIPKTTNQAIKMENRIVIMGGTKPGHSTDYVGVELAIKSKSEKFIIATNVNGVYDKDPNKFNYAKQIKEIDADKLISKYGVIWKSAGSNIVIDGPALELIKDNELLTYVLNGKQLEELEKALLNEKFNGTIIKNNKR